MQHIDHNKRMRGRPPERPFTDPFVLQLCEELDAWTPTELARKTGIPSKTWRNWGLGEKSPLSSLNIAEKLQAATGKTLGELIQGFSAKQ